MNVLIPFVALLAIADHAEKKQTAPAQLIEGLGSIHHPVATKNPLAQKFFDQGLRLLYAFNHDEARRAFARAAELDPACAMAFWGLALAVGPNYNVDAEEMQLKEAYAAIQKALKLSKNGVAHERAYIEALTLRYAADPAKADKKKLALAYSKAMGELSRRYPDDLDAATLYAESMMNLRPWQLWTKDGKPAEGTVHILEVLEGVLRRNPDHTGANHYYIHAIEASPYPERGLGAADRLRNLAPGAGHLVHMPSHIYIRLGDYQRAAEANIKAAAADKAYLDKFQPTGIYPMMYYSHNLHFLAVAHAMQGASAESTKAAQALAKHVEPHVKEMPMLEFFLATPILIHVRFRRWQDVLALPEPPEQQYIVRALRHFARGLAFQSGAKLEQAQRELQALRKAIAGLPTDAPYSDLNKAAAVLVIPENVLAAKIALANKQTMEATQFLKRAIEAEDNLNYIEPADWYLPVREILGVWQLRDGDAAAAEATFRSDLKRHPRNPIALAGLVAALQAQDRTYEAALVSQELESACRHADVKIKAID